MSSTERRLGIYTRRYARLRRELADTGFLWIGTVLRQYQICGKPGCRCARGGRFRHGPYYVWTRKVRGKTVTRMLSEVEGRLYTAWIQNRRRLDATVQRMMHLSARAAPFVLAQRSARG